MQDITKSIDACAAYYGDDAIAVKQYLLDGENRALELSNRGPLKFDDNGDIASIGKVDDLILNQAIDNFSIKSFDKSLFLYSNLISFEGIVIIFPDLSIA